MAIRKVLDLSTGHLKEDTRVDLGMGVEVGIRYTEHKYGWIFFLGKDMTFNKDYPDLLEALDYANAHECMFINFDADAETIEALPTWNDNEKEEE